MEFDFFEQYQLVLGVMGLLSNLLLKSRMRTKYLSRWTLLLGWLLLAGCAHVQSLSQDHDRVAAVAGTPAPQSFAGILQENIKLPSDLDQHLDPASQKEVSPQKNSEIVVQGIKLKNTHFDFPVSVNSRVEYWIDYFCGRGRNYFSRYLERSEFFIPYIVPLLKKNGVPEDLVYLAMIESGFNNLARSRAKAVGPWQFISATGRRYGLSVSWWQDDRRSIEKSTLAAVGYLKDLYGMFQSWELAAAAYNSGEAKIARAVRRYGTKDFWVIAKQRFLRPETRDYVPKIIAAAIISKNRSLFGFAEQEPKPGQGEVVAGDGEIVKLIKTEKPLDDQVSAAQRAEDEFDSEQDLTTEPSLVGAVAETLPSVSSAPLAKPIPTPHVTKTGEVGGEELMDFEVQSPADLLKVARAAGLSYQTVKALNPEILRWCTPPTQKTYIVKLPVSVKDRFLVTYNHEAFPRKVQFMTYKVHRGETLQRIARHFGIKVDPMSDLNGLSPKVALQVGHKILLPIPNDRSRTFASLEVRDPPERRSGGRRRSHRRHVHKAFRVTYKPKNKETSGGPSLGVRAHRRGQSG